MILGSCTLTQALSQKMTGAQQALGGRWSTQQERLLGIFLLISQALIFSCWKENYL